MYQSQLPCSHPSTGVTGKRPKRDRSPRSTYRTRSGAGVADRCHSRVRNHRDPPSGGPRSAHGRALPHPSSLRVDPPPFASTLFRLAAVSSAGTSPVLALAFPIAGADSCRLRSGRCPCGGHEQEGPGGWRSLLGLSYDPAPTPLPANIDNSQIRLVGGRGEESWLSFIRFRVSAFHTDVLVRSLG